MNATVKRIVELMFEDLLPSDEVATLRDEVMANCQARYQDCVDRGLSEDDAIGAVVQSLKGMEEVLSGYPKKEASSFTNEYTAAPEEPQHDGAQLTFAPYEVNTLNVSLVSQDVTLERSPDSMIHVRLLGDCNAQTQLEDGKLHISFNPMQRPHGSKPRFDFNFDKLDLDSIGSMFQGFVQHARTVMKELEGDVVISLPDGYPLLASISTTNGDVHVLDVHLTELLCNTASGDIEVRLSRAVRSASANTASGDVSMKLDAEQVNIKTMSGDVSYTGHCDHLQMNTVSGDMHLEGVMQLNARSVSGDAELMLSARSRATVNTTSGDIRLAANASSVHADVRSTSGDIRRGRQLDLGELSEVVLHAVTVSGDIQIR